MRTVNWPILERTETTFQWHTSLRASPEEFPEGWYLVSLKSICLYIREDPGPVGLKRIDTSHSDCFLSGLAPCGLKLEVCSVGSCRHIGVTQYFLNCCYPYTIFIWFQVWGQNIGFQSVSHLFPPSINTCAFLAAWSLRPSPSVSPALDCDDTLICVCIGASVSTNLGIMPIIFLEQQIHFPNKNVGLTTAGIFRISYFTDKSGLQGVSMDTYSPIGGGGTLAGAPSVVRRLSPPSFVWLLAPLWCFLYLLSKLATARASIVL